jgi:patatin-related protein
MRQKELRIALVCYGGVSLAVYMHGVTKELWHLARASRAFHSEAEPRPDGVAGVYHDLLTEIEKRQDLKLRVMLDILAGSSAGGINTVFLAQAVHSGQSLEPLTDMWLENADIDFLLDPEARLWSRFFKYWATPIARLLLASPASSLTESVAPETRNEVNRKLSKLIRSRWFAPPFSGPGFSNQILDALSAMASIPAEMPLLPPGHPLDMLVTATDFRGSPEAIALNSPPIVEESEHRMAIALRMLAPNLGGSRFADPLELAFAARATASLPGAFPPLQLGEIDQLAELRGVDWSTRDDFLAKIMPGHVRQGDCENVSLIDGSVLVNAPFGAAIRMLTGRPARHSVDRRFIYIDPRPDRKDNQIARGRRGKKVGFFEALFGSLSGIPRSQPIRDDLEKARAMSREAEAIKSSLAVLRPEVEGVVASLLGDEIGEHSPTPEELANWRSIAQQAAAEQAGYTYHAYTVSKFDGITARIANLVKETAPSGLWSDIGPPLSAIRAELERRGVSHLSKGNEGANPSAIAFFRAFDIGFRIRRLRLLAQRLTREWDDASGVDETERDTAMQSVFEAQSMFTRLESPEFLEANFADLAANVIEEPGALLDWIEENWDLTNLDGAAEGHLVKAFSVMPLSLRKRGIGTYLGFPFYDVATLPLSGSKTLTEFDPIKVDRISPDDAQSIREGGAPACLRGIEFYHFGAFFSRAYRENDYVWGRLQGAERMIDLVCSTLDDHPALDQCQQFKRRAFLAILDEEEGRMTADPGLLDRLRQEVEERLPAY